MRLTQVAEKNDNFDRLETAHLALDLSKSIIRSEANLQEADVNQTTAYLDGLSKQITRHAARLLQGFGDQDLQDMMGELLRR